MALINYKITNYGLHEYNVKCPAVAYRITSNQLNLLDQYEGTPDHYLRISLPFRAIDGNNTMVQAYVAHPDQLVEEQKPESEYLEHIQNGYEEHGFDLDSLIEQEVITNNR